MLRPNAFSTLSAISGDSEALLFTRSESVAEAHAEKPRRRRHAQPQFLEGLDPDEGFRDAGESSPS